MPTCLQIASFASLDHEQLDGFDYVVIGLYLAAMLALGAVLSTQIRAFKDYFLAGGALTTPLLICTLVSSYYGIEVTFGTSESGFYYGVVAWFWYSLPYYFFFAFAALVIAPRLKRYEARDALIQRGAPVDEKRLRTEFADRFVTEDLSLIHI